MVTNLEEEVSGSTKKNCKNGCLRLSASLKKMRQKQFGFLLEAMDYGFPPHGGLALGLDRFVMLLAGEENIREVIAFPKNNKATDPMTQAPSTVATKQLEELSLQVEVKTEE